MPKRFLPKRNFFVEEIRSTFIEWEHAKTGARLLHLHNSDPENLFAITLSTFPENSNGVAHILEHMVLCGSKKFPVKDPFFSMIRRSLNTFMNAFTGSDFTCYPAASQNKTDFYNLLEVYLDAVFAPNLDERSFRQEGHRLQWKEPQQKRGLERAGIVFNEMKGAYLQPETSLRRALEEKLFSQTSYRFDSGGDPQEIPSLSYQELLDFHKKYYDPSRALFFFYGDIPTEEHADFLDKQLLAWKERTAPPLQRELQKSFSAPIKEEATFPALFQESEANKPMAAIAWLGPSLEQRRENLMLGLLDTLLMGHDGSPLKRFLIESNLSDSLYSHLDQERLQSYYALVFQNVESDSLEIVQSAVQASLERIYQEGFSPKSISSALHRLKVARLEISGGGYPFGLLLFFRCLGHFQQGSDPLDALKLREDLESLESLLQNPQELLDSMKRSLLDNPHRVDLWMRPDVEKKEQREREEEKLLQTIEASWTEEQKINLLEEQEALEEAQRKGESRVSLPLIPIEKIARSGRKIELTEIEQGALRYHETFTNGFLYQEAHLVLDPLWAQSLSLEQWQQLKLLAYLWPRLGACKRSYSEQLEQMHSCCANLQVDLQLLVGQEEPASQREKTLALFSFSIHGLQSKADDFLLFLQETILELRLDEKERILHLLRKLASDLEHQLPASALCYALSASAQPFGSFAALRDWIDGLPFLQYIKKSSEHLHEESAYTLWIASVENLRSSLCGQTLLQTATVESAQGLDAWKRAGIELLSHFQAPKSFEGLSLPPFPKKNSSAYRLNGEVSFLALSLPAPKLMAPEAMALRLACEIIRQQVLHREIREKGGAYGYGCSYHPEKGVVSFHSYRDPQIKRTLEVFQESTLWLLEGSFDSEMIDEAKRVAIQRLDRPLAPGERGSCALVWQLQNRDLPTRERLRAALLDASASDILQAAKKWLLPIKEAAVFSLFGPEKEIEKQTQLKAQQP